MHWYIDVLKKYTEFTGRAGREEYWMFQLFNIIAIILVAILLGKMGMNLYTLVTLLPSLAVAVRRLHDTDRSGWWLLLSFVPIVGGIAILVILAIKGTPGANRYDNPPMVV